MANKKKKTEEKQPKIVQDTRRQVWAVVLFVLALLFFAIVLLPLEGGWNAIHKFLYGVFGWTAVAFPILLGFIAVQLAMESVTIPKLYLRVFQCVAFLLLAGGLTDIFANADMTDFGTHTAAAFTMGGKGGGWFSSLLSFPVVLFATKTGAAIIYILLAFLLIMFVTRTTLMTFLKTVYKPVKAAGENVRAGVDEILERHRNQDEDELSYDVPLTEEEERKQRGKNKVNSKDATLGEKGRKLVNTYWGKEGEEPIQEDEPELDEDSMSDEPDLDEIISKRADAAKLAAAMQPSPEEVAQPAEDAAKKKKAAAEAQEPAEEPKPTYRFPPVALLERAGGARGGNEGDEIRSNAEKLIDTLRSFGVEARLLDVSRGPAVTRYELQPSAGVKISKITALADDIALNLASAGVRIEAPIPNKAAIGIEVPNKNTAVVGIRDMIESAAFREAKSRLTVALGKDIGGECITTDLAKMPHLLIAGSTGSGKSVCINSLIISLIYKATPDEVKFVMIDPKMVELGGYNGIPHLIIPVVTDPRKAAGALGWAVTEMLKRYKTFGEFGVKDLKSYNALAETREDLEKMPQMVIIIDELADLMMAAPNEVEDNICRLAQMARAAGMHLVIATQRPSVDVITGLIKANIPSRIAFAVANQFDSRTILDSVGAEKLLGRGDMLFSPVGCNKPMRIQGCFVSDRETESVISFIKSNAETQYSEDVEQQILQNMPAEKGKKAAAADGDSEVVVNGDEDIITAAIGVVVEAGIASTSLLQRKLKLGYARAARIVDEMEERGVVGPFEGSKPRKVLISKQQWLEMQNRE